MRSLLVGLAAAASFVSSAAAAQTAKLPDQFNVDIPIVVVTPGGPITVPSGVGNSFLTSGIFGQTFRPLLNAIDYASFQIYGSSGTATGVNETVFVSLFSGINLSGAGNALATSNTITIPFNAGRADYDFLFPTRVSLTPGQDYTLLFTSVTAPSDNVALATTGNNYLRGAEIRNGSTGQNTDLVFSEGILVPATPAVPEPGTWVTLMLGMGAVGYAMRRRRASLRLAQKA